MIPQSLESAARWTTFGALSGPTPFATLDFAREGRIDAMTLCRKELSPSDGQRDFSMAVCQKELTLFLSAARRIGAAHC